MGNGVLAFATTAKYEIRLQSARGFSASKRRLLLRGGRETTSEGGKQWNARGSKKRGEYYCYRLNC
jgi:hypothetical protein